MELKRPRLIAVEGIDGSGKTTLIKLLKDSLAKKGYRVKTWKMKGHTFDIARFFAEEKMDYENQYMKLSALTFDLMEKNRDIKDSSDCDYIIFDRYRDSLDAYFGSLDVSLPWVEEIKKYMYEPHLVILLNASVEVALERLNRRSEGLKQLENKDYLSLVKERYLFNAGGECLVLNADLPAQKLCELAMKRLTDSGENSYD